MRKCGRIKKNSYGKSEEKNAEKRKENEGILYGKIIKMVVLLFVFYENN